MGLLHFAGGRVAVKRGRPGNVAFIHVPAGRSDEDMNVGVEIWKAFSGA